jgi:PAS domain S-box-containing protein
MHWKTERHLILWAFVAALGILAFAGWESHRDTVRVAEAASARKRSYEVQGMIDETAARLVDAETGQRGYLLTGDDAYLEPYRRAIRSLDRTMGQLKDFTSDNPDQQKRIRALEPLVEKKLAELQATIDLRKSKGLAAANTVVLAGSGKQLMDQIRVVLEEMASKESDFRSIRMQEMNEALASANRAVVGGSLLSILLLSLVFTILLRELSERKVAQEALAKREKWFSTTLGSIGDAVIATDMNGAVTFMNSVAQSLTGWSLEAAQGKSMDLVFDIVNKETRRPGENPVKKVFREGKVVGLADHTLLISKNGKEFEIEDSAAPIVTGVGESIGVVLVFRDITDIKRAEEELRRSEERFRLMVESAVDYAILMLDPEGHVVSWNAGAERIKGYRAEEIIGRHFSQFYPREDLERGKPQHELEVAIEKGRLEDEGWRVRKDGSTFWANVIITALRDEVGTLRGFGKVTRDMTESKRAQDALRESKERYHLLFDSNPHPVWVYDLETLGILDVNHSAVRNYGFSREEFLSLTIRDIRPPEDIPALLDSTAERSPDTEFSGAWKHRKKDGTLIDVEITSHPLVYGGRDVRLVVATDITDRKNAEEALLRAKEEAERASKFKDQFLSTMSHELRTPLNAILGFSELLTDKRYGEMNERQSRYVNHIHTSGKHLLKLISDILDLSKIEAGKMEIVREDVAVDSVYTEVLSALQPLADKKSQTLIRQVEPNLYVRADPTRFKQILMNLIGNAIKFTPERGRIELAARSMDGQVRVEVSDNGPGIPLEDQQRIFEAFYRQAESGKAVEGTGLGLAITERLVHMHGSQLGIDSRPGQGTCFHFSFPLVVAPQVQSAQAVTAKPEIRRAPRIFVIEDDPASAHLIESQLSSSGYEAIRCKEPRRARELAAKLQPDAITLDLLMKPIHGVEVLLQLKNDPRTSKIPVIVVTIVDQPAIGTALGADEYLVKPVDKAALLAALERCLAARGGRPPTRAILVVEDDGPTREVISEMLHREGYSVTTAADGEQARASVAKSLPELVILDLLLPKVSGFELLSEWRVNPRTADLSVFVLTSKELSKDEEKYLRMNSEYLYRKQQAWQEELINQLRRVVAQPQAEKA